MGIFSLFGKKENHTAKVVGKSPSRSKRPLNPVRLDSSGKVVTRPVPTRRDLEAALATALKIDAIESEMSSEFVATTQARNTSPPRPSPPPDNIPSPAALKTTQDKEPQPTLPPVSAEHGTTTAFLLRGQTAVDNVAAPSAEAAAVIEEAAILYANGQLELVGQMLRSAIEQDNLGNATLKAWWMLFDLYQIEGRQQEFEQLSIVYTNKFETSPPAWTDQGQQQVEPETPSGATPAIPFSGKLDTNCTKLIERVQNLAENYRTLRLEFARVTEVSPEGCSLLLDALKKLQKSGHDLILVGAPDLAKKIRAIVAVGRRDDTEDPWLLLLEILRLLNLEQEFEETSIDYCITFEVSPPAFTPPHSNVTTAAAENLSPPASEGFLMPPVVEGRIDSLIVSIASYSDEHCPAIIDCSQMRRIDFTAAGRLLTGLAPFCGNGKVIEFHYVNHLVAELFNVIGLRDIVRIVPRKG